MKFRGIEEWWVVSGDRREVCKFYFIIVMNWRMCNACAILYTNIVLRVQWQKKKKIHACDKGADVFYSETNKKFLTPIFKSRLVSRAAVVDQLFFNQFCHCTYSVYSGSRFIQQVVDTGQRAVLLPVLFCFTHNPTTLCLVCTFSSFCW